MDQRWITDTTPNERWPIYTRANAAEVMGDPVSPLGWTYVWSGPACPPGGMPTSRRGRCRPGSSRRIPPSPAASAATST